MEREERGYRWIIGALLYAGTARALCGALEMWLETRPPVDHATLVEVRGYAHIAGTLLLIACIGGLAALRRDSAWLAALGIAIGFAADNFLVRYAVVGERPPAVLMLVKSVGILVGVVAGAIAVARTLRAAGQTPPRAWPLVVVVFLLAGQLMFPFGVLGDRDILPVSIGWPLARLIELGATLLVALLLRRRLRQPWQRIGSPALGAPLAGEGWTQGLRGLNIYERALRLQFSIQLVVAMSAAFIALRGFADLAEVLPVMTTVFHIGALVAVLVALCALRRLPDVRVRQPLPLALALSVLLAVGHAVVSWRFEAGQPALVVGGFLLQLAVLTALRRLARAVDRPRVVALAGRTVALGLGAILLFAGLRWRAHVESGTVATQLVGVVALALMFVYYVAHVGLVRDLRAALASRLTTTNVFD